MIKLINKILKKIGYEIEIRKEYAWKAAKSFRIGQLVGYEDYIFRGSKNIPYTGKVVGEEKGRVKVEFKHYGSGIANLKKEKVKKLRIRNSIHINRIKGYQRNNY